MSAAKKRRELNRATEEHDRARIRHELSTAGETMTTIAESFIGQYVKELESKLASRDADVAKWKSIAANKADQVDAAKEVIAEVKQERDQLSEQVAMLRDALKESVTIVGRGLSADVWARCREALAATEPK